MKPSMIVYGVPNGKTRFAERIAKFYGLELVKKEFQGDPGISGYGEIHFTRKKTAPEGFYEPYAKSFREVADEINAAIPLTDWQRGNPVLEGEYIANFDKSDLVRSYWSKKGWSYFFYEVSPQKFKNDCASFVFEHKTTKKIVWRGLSEEPIVID